MVSVRAVIVIKISYKKTVIMHCLYSSVNKRVKYSTSLSAAISQTFTVANTHLQTVEHTDISYQHND